MKKLFYLCIFCILCGVLSAQDITITFQSKVDTVSIDSISVINQRNNKIVKLLGGDSLLLVKTATSVNQMQINPEIGYIYPNPTEDNATLCFSTDKTEEVEIGLSNINGQLLRHEKQILTQGTHRFLIKFPVAGIYYLSVFKSDGLLGLKAVYTGRKTRNSSIMYVGNEKLNSLDTDAKQLKSAASDKTLNYIEGDVIQYSFFSGVNTTIISDIPTKSKTIYVEFDSCIDNDNRSYKIVQIGDQLWMAENFAYLPSVNPVSESSATEPYYYVYDYDDTIVGAAKATSNYSTYGVLYNWPAAIAACPPGWHLPNDAEWTELEDYLIANGYGFGGSGDDIAKSMAAKTNWESCSGVGTPGNDLDSNNSSGFSALPGGYRVSGGIFVTIGSTATWWSSTELSTNYASYIVLTIMGDLTQGIYYYKGGGLSVRYVKD